MPTVESAGGESIVRPLLHVDIDPADTDTKPLVVANWTEIQAARDLALSLNATLVLPAGKIYASASENGAVQLPILTLDDRHSGMTIRGAGPRATVLADPYRGANADVRIQGRAIGDILIAPDPGFWPASTTYIFVPLSDVENYQEDEVIYFWVVNEGSDRTIDRQRCRITAVNTTTGRIDFTPAMTDDWNRGRQAKGFEVTGAVLVGDTSATLTNSSFAEHFKINDDMIIGDGPGFNEFYGEFVTVTDVDGATISFHPPVRRKYETDLTCLIPPPHLTDITVRDLAFAGPVGLGPTIRWTGFFKYGRRLRMENFDIVRDGEDGGNPSEIGFYNCGDFFISNCRLGNLAIGGASHDGMVDNLTVAAIGGEEYCMDMRFSRIETSSFFFSGRIEYGGFVPCVRIVLTDSLLNGATKFGFTDESQYSNINIVNFQGDGEIVYANADNSTVENITSNVPMRFRGLNWRITNVTAPTVTIEKFPLGPTYPTTGVFLTPLNGDPAEYADSTPAGAIQRPLLVNKDGTAQAPQAKYSDMGDLETPGLILPSPADDVVPLTIRPAESQTANLQEWQDDGEAVLFAIRVDGNLASANVEETAPPGDPDWRLPIYGPAGTQIGWIPVHPME